MGSIGTPDRRGESHGIARFAWRALFVCAFAVIALLAANGSASAKECGNGEAECAAADPAAPADPGTVEQDPSADDSPAQVPPPAAPNTPADGPDADAPADRDHADERPGPAALVKAVVRPTIDRVLELPNKLAARPAAKSKSTAAVEAGPADRPVVEETPTVADGSAVPAPTKVHVPSRVPSTVVDDAAPNSTVDLVIGLTHDIARAPSGIAARVDETIESLARPLTPSPARATAAGAFGLLSVTRTITSLLPALDVEATVAPILAGLSETLAQTLSPVAPVLDVALVPVLRPTVVTAGTALNPEGHDRSEPSQAPVDADAQGATATVPTTTSAPLAGVTSTRLGAMRLDTGSLGSTSQSWRTGTDRLIDAAEVSDGMPVPANGASAPAPGPDGSDGPGVQGVGGASASSADLGKVLVGALNLPGNSRTVGVHTDSWRLPDSLGSEPGHSPA